MLAPPELLKVHPLGKSPVITDGDITRRRVGRDHRVPARDLRREPACARRRARPSAGATRYWLHFAEGSAMPPLVMKLVFQRVKSGADAVLRQADRARHRRQGAARVRRPEPASARSPSWRPSSRNGPWFAGAGFSAADIQMSFPVEAASQRAGLDASATPRLAAGWSASTRVPPTSARSSAAARTTTPDAPPASARHPRRSSLPVNPLALSWSLNQASSPKMRVTALARPGVFGQSLRSSPPAEFDMRQRPYRRRSSRRSSSRR